MWNIVKVRTSEAMPSRPLSNSNRSPYLHMLLNPILQKQILFALNYSLRKNYKKRLHNLCCAQLKVSSRMEKFRLCAHCRELYKSQQHAWFIEVTLLWLKNKWYNISTLIQDFEPSQLNARYLVI